MNQHNTNSSSEGDLTTPRLFRLRDLHPSKTTNKPSSAAEAPGQPAAMPTQTISPAPQLFHAHATTAQENAFGQRLENSPAPSRQQQAVDELNLGSTPETAGSVDPRIHRQEVGSPEGRSWMESAMAHRKVLILLAIAVGAAFWTRRNPQDPQSLDGTQSSIVTNGESLEFGTDEFDLGTGASEGPGWDEPGNASDFGSNQDIASTQLSTQSTTTPQPSGPTATQTLTPPGVPASNSLATLSGDVVPQTTTPQTAPPSYADAKTGMVQAGMVQAGMAQAPVQAAARRSSPAGDGLDVLAVSSSTPNTPSLDIPSMDELQAVVDQSDSELVLRDSATPNGVADWLRYLPPGP